MWLADDCSCEVKWTRTDKSYVLSKCELRLDGEDIHVKMSGGRQKPIEFDIEDYKSKTALQAMKVHDVTSGDLYLGRHFEDCVFDAWRDLGLNLGYVEDVTRPL